MARPPRAREPDQERKEDQEGGSRPAVRRVKRLLQLLVLALVAYLAVTQFDEFRGALGAVLGVDPALFGAGLALQVGARLAHAVLTRSLLKPGARPPLGTLVRIELASRAVSHVVPGGTAAGTALEFRLLHERVGGAMAGFAVAGQGIGSAVVLNALLWLALLVSIPARGFDPLYTTAALLAIVLLGGFAALVLVLVRGQERAQRTVAAVVRRIPLIDPEPASRAVGDIADRLRALAADRRVLAVATAWSAGAWLLDAGSLWVFLAAFGHPVGPVGLMVSFGLAYVLAAAPITPGGLGVVEAALTSTLVGFGVPSGTAFVAVISYRLVNYWLPIPVGALAYLSLQVGEPEQGWRKQLSSLVRSSREKAESARAWAARVGLGRRRDRRR